MFQTGLGTFEGPEVSLVMDTGAPPRFCEAVGDELERLVKKGTLEPVDYAEWAAPIVAVLKSNRKSAAISV